LDYLITLKQLLVLDSKVSLEDFHKNSKIEGIVEGKPTDKITKDHIAAINTKIKAMRLL
jgi:DNA anti-recombination protein RmuC